MNINIPVSVGELVDKITILEIKQSKIKNDIQLKNVRNELEKLTNIYNKIELNLETKKTELKKINEQLWDIENSKRVKEKLKLFDDEFITLARNVYLFNDKRAEIKKDINIITKSQIIEEKCHNKKAIFLGHLGLGDNILCNGLVRTIAMAYDEVVVVCKYINVKNVEIMYSDNDRIKTLCVNDATEADLIFKNTTIEYDRFASGCPANKNVYDFPYSFYDDVKIDRRNFWNMFYIPQLDFSKELFNTIKDIPYIFIHNKYSSGYADIEYIKKFLNSNDTLYINPCINMYNKGDKYYEIANSLLDKPLAYYTDVIINALKIFMVDSSFFCMAINLDIKTSECYFTPKNNNHLDQMFLTLYETHPCNRKIFKRIVF